MAIKLSGAEARQKLLIAFNTHSSHERHGHAIVAQMIAGLDYAELGKLTELAETTAAMKALRLKGTLKESEEREAFDTRESIFNSPAVKEKLAQPVRDYINQLPDEAAADVVNSIIAKHKSILRETTWDTDPKTGLSTGMPEDVAMALAAVFLQKEKIGVEDFYPDTFTTKWWVEQMEKATEPNIQRFQPSVSWIGQIAFDKPKNTGKER